MHKIWLQYFGEFEVREQYSPPMIPLGHSVVMLNTLEVTPQVRSICLALRCKVKVQLQYKYMGGLFNWPIISAHGGSVKHTRPFFNVVFVSGAAEAYS